MKFEPTRLPEYSDEGLASEIGRVADLVGGPSLSTAEFKAHARVGLTTLRRRFGGWREALGAAGLAHLYNEVPAVRISPTLGRTWTRENVITELQRVASLLGRNTVTVDDFRAHAIVGLGTVRSRFGTWPAALRAAGLDSVSHGKRYTDEQCFENLLTVWMHLGRPPKYQEMGNAPSTVGGKAYVKRWRTWNRAIHAFIAYAESDSASPSTEPPQPVTAASHVGASRLRPEDMREPSVGLRYRVLKRDRFRCVSCGRSPATDLGCELHVDHVHPFSKGGKTTLDNLRSSCAECNLGKGAALDV